MKKWRCLVCNYIHTGDTPPENCPVCGASKDKFVEYIEETEDLLENAQSDLGNKTYDVVVVGSGASALTAAITAHAKGLSVVVLEKADKAGGTSARSGGRYWVPNNKLQRKLGIEDSKEDCLKYMLRYAYPAKFNADKVYYGVSRDEYELLETYYDNASVTFDFLDQIGVMESEFEFSWKQKPQVDYMDHLKENKGIRGRTLMPKTDAGAGVSGFDLINLLLTYLNNNDVEIITDCRVENVIKNADNAVVGVETTNKKSKQIFYANKGVIFGTGGFSHNNDLMSRFQPGQNYGGCAVPENTGDLVYIAEKNALKLGNMANAFRAQSMVDMYVDNPEGSSNIFYIIGDSIMQVNKYGKRVINEKRNYTDRTMTHYKWDENNAEWPNRLMFLVFDQRTAQLWQGFPPLPVGDTSSASYVISGQTYDELASNIAGRLEELKDLTANFKLEDDFTKNFKETVERFNGFARNGVDEDFHRGETDYDQEFTTFPPTIPNTEWPPEESKNITMYPFSEEGPYYAIILGAGTLDTSGGPIVNTHAQMIDCDNKPVVGLYGAGNCISSIGKNAYWGAGSTLGPGMTYAYLAVEHLSKQKDNLK